MMLSRNAGRAAAIFGAVVLAVAGLLLWLGAGNGDARAARTDAALQDIALPGPVAEEELPGALPAPAPRSREEKRFARIDRDDDGRIMQAEFLAQRRRNFDRLDVNGDGRLSFEEHAGKGIERFRKADADGNGHLAAPEFATTASKPRPTQSAANGRCPPVTTASAQDEQ